MEEVLLTAGSQTHYTEEGCLISNSGELVIGTTAGVIPTSVTSIGYRAFSGRLSFTELVIPENVTSVSSYAFANCTDLKTVTIAKTVETLGQCAFYNCTSLTDIYCEASSKPDGWSVGYYTWIEGCPAEVHWGYKPTDANLAFAGASVTLFDDLTVNFKVSEALFETYSDPYVVFVMNGAEVTVTEYVVEDGYYVFAFDDILPNQMNDEISATLYATADETIYKGEALSYSVATYCYNMLNKYSDDEKLRTLLVDILGYGAATQTYTSYNTANLANAGLTDEQKAWASPDREFATVEDVDYETVANPTATWTVAGLNLSESIAVRFAFEAESTDGLTAKITCGGNTWEISDFAAEGEGYSLRVGINAGYMSEPIYVTLYDGETAVSDTVCYSIESYAWTYSENAELGALVKAMIKYGDAASKYITKG